jgi:hypothetical protein
VEIRKKPEAKQASRGPRRVVALRQERLARFNRVTAVAGGPQRQARHSEPGSVPGRELLPGSQRARFGRGRPAGSYGLPIFSPRTVNAVIGPVTRCPPAAAPLR